MRLTILDLVHASIGVVSPDNRSRIDLNTAIHQARQDAGQVSRHERAVTVLIGRHDITGADRAWAQHYDVGDVIRYTRGSRVLGVEAGAYAL